MQSIGDSRGWRQARPDAGKVRETDDSGHYYKKNGTAPPSTDHDAPVTFDACSEQRKTITAAISSGSPRRPIGTFDPAVASSSSREVPARSPAWAAMPRSPVHSSVAVGPGATAFTRTPLSAYSSAKTRDSDS